jgi:multidrug efflux system outer membrane protein
MRNFKTGPVLALAAFLSACAVGPDYRPPRVSPPDSFVNVDAAQFSSEDVERDFWKSFGDSQLDALVEEALVANHDIRIATARLREARALRGEAQLDFAPTLTTSAGRTEARGSVRQVAPSANASREQDFYDAGFDAVWELDLFGRVRRGVEARSAEVQAAEADVYSTQVSITAEVARNYFELRGAQQRLAVARRNADNQRETLRITTARLDAGRGTELDTSRARAQLAATLATIPDLETTVTRNTLRLGVLVGRSPEALMSQLSAPQKLPVLPVAQRIGTPELLLRRRPDIRSAERSLAAATAEVGVATGDLFPRITFVGRWGFNAADRSELGNAGSESYSFGPSIQWAGFDLGRVRQRIKQREASAERSLAVYEKTVLQALEETDASLTAYAKAIVKQAHLQGSASASSQAATLARARYESGAADFLTVLDAERSSLVAEDQLAQSETQAATALLATYKALGGGFRPLGPELTAYK